jgi:crotonobetainyl-CoA:carnitine CoA-transferase CaiB-like acyl-CoA transferase
VRCVVLTGLSPRNVEALLEGIGTADWREDTKVATDAAHQVNWKSLMNVIETWTSTWATNECTAAFAKAAVPAARYNTCAKLWRSRRPSIDAAWRKFRTEPPTIWSQSHSSCLAAMSTCVRMFPRSESIPKR